MKKLILLFVFVVFSSMMNAQTAAPAATKAVTTAPATGAKAVATHPKQVANPAAYACMKCFNIEKAAGKCSKCQADKVQLGTYYCEHCAKGTGPKAGKCSACGGNTTQMTRKFCATKTGKEAKPAVAPKKAA